jgi:hypothetical protein
LKTPKTRIRIAYFTVYYDDTSLKTPMRCETESNIRYSRAGHISRISHASSLISISECDARPLMASLEERTHVHKTSKKRAKKKEEKKEKKKEKGRGQGRTGTGRDGR